MPEKTFVIAAVASATPSMTPMVTMEAPKVVAMNTGSRLCISSEEVSMNNEPRPMAQMPVGMARNVALLIDGLDDFPVVVLI
jgi:hypothetical protein